MDYEPKLKRLPHGVEAHCFPGKEKIASTVVSKQGDADSLVGYEKPITIDFLKRGAVVNSAFYCQLLRQYFTLFIG